MSQSREYEAGMLNGVDNPRRIDDDVLLTDNRGRTAYSILVGMARNYRTALSKPLNDISVVIRSAVNAALGPPIDEGLLLRLLHVRLITSKLYVLWNKPLTHAPHAFEKEPLWKAILHRNASAALCDAVRALWVDFEHIVEQFDPDTLLGSHMGLEVRAMDAFGVDFGQPWGTMGMMTLGAWLRSHVHDEDEDTQDLCETLDEVTAPLSMDGARALIIQWRRPIRALELRLVSDGCLPKCYAPLWKICNAGPHRCQPAA
jgi:hypothetical protein